MGHSKVLGSALSLAVGTMLALATPAAAQPFDRHDGLLFSRALNTLGADRSAVTLSPANQAASRTASTTMTTSSAPTDPTPRPRPIRSFHVRPVNYVGDAGDCAPGYPAGAAFVTSEWLSGMGLPDYGQQNENPLDPRDNPAKRDSHAGLLLSKNGPTPDCSAAAAKVTGTPSAFVISDIGFDYRNGTHCGAGSPRFNAITPEGRIYFIGCGDGTKSPAPQSPTEWTRVRFRSDQIYPQYVDNPPFILGVTVVERLAILTDEGTDTATSEETSGVGLVVIDNVTINGHTETGP